MGLDMRDHIFLSLVWDVGQRLYRVGDKRPPHPLLSQGHEMAVPLGWT